MFGLGRSADEKELDAWNQEIQAILRTVDGSTGGEDQAIALLFLTHHFRHGKSCSSYIDAALKSRSEVAKIASVNIGREEDYFARLPGENMKRLLQVYAK